MNKALHRLPTSPLELFTLAIVICTLISYAFWWNKALDVATGLVVEMPEPEGQTVYIDRTDRDIKSC